MDAAPIGAVTTVGNGKALVAPSPILLIVLIPLTYLVRRMRLGGGNRPKGIKGTLSSF